MIVSIIVAADEGGVIGSEGGIPWHLPDDLRWFKKNTLKKTLIMGRRTYESIGRPLPGRETIVVTRNPNYDVAGCQIADSFEMALALAASSGAGEAVAAGGTSIYEAALKVADRIYMTHVHAAVSGDTHFPDSFDPGKWREVWREEHAADARHVFSFTFTILERDLGASDG